MILQQVLKALLVGLFPSFCCFLSVCPCVSRRWLSLLEDFLFSRPSMGTAQVSSIFTPNSKMSDCLRP